MSSWLKDIGGSLISGAASLLGGGISAITGKQSGDREYERQKEFAQNGLRWKVADAKAAGIHPIFAVGANTATYSPQAAVGSDYGVSAAGQNISRAIEAGQTRREREEMADVQKRYYEAQISNVEAQTRQHEAQTESIRQGIINDALYNNTDFLAQSALASSDKVRNHGGVPPKPTTESVDGYWGKTIPELQRVKSPDGRISAIIISNELHDAVEDIHLFEMLPYIVNGVQVGFKVFGAKNGAELYGYRWHQDTHQWIRNPKWRMPKPLKYEDAFRETTKRISPSKVPRAGGIRGFYSS